MCIQNLPDESAKSLETDSSGLANPTCPCAFEVPEVEAVEAVQRPPLGAKGCQVCRRCQQFKCHSYGSDWQKIMGEHFFLDDMVGWMLGGRSVIYE